MNYHQKARRNKDTALHRYNTMMQRHKTRYHIGPVGALRDQWCEYIDWLNEWKAEIIKHRDAELNRLDAELKRRAHERKRSYNYSRRGS